MGSSSKVGCLDNIRLGKELAACYIHPMQKLDLSLQVKGFELRLDSLLPIPVIKALVDTSLSLPGLHAQSM